MRSRRNRPANPAETRAEIEEKQGNPLEAVREYQRAAETNPSESNYFNWGAELLVHRAAEPAIEVFSKGARLFPALGTNADRAGRGRVCRRFL